MKYLAIEKHYINLLLMQEKLHVITMQAIYQFYLECILDSDLQMEYFANTSHENQSRASKPIQDGPFRDCSRMLGKKDPFPKICDTYPTMIKLGTVIPYLKKIQQIYESRDAPFEFSWHQRFFTEKQQILLYQEIQI